MPPKKGVAYTIDVGLPDAADGSKFKADPTLAAGDFKVSTGGGVFANLATLPTVLQAGSKTVRIIVSPTEMLAYDVVIECSDPDDEWADVILSITPTDANVDDLVRATTPGNTLTVNASGLVKLASDGLDAISTTAPAGMAANFREMIVQVWRRKFKKATLTRGTGELVTYADDDATPITTQTLTDVDGTQTQGGG